MSRHIRVLQIGSASLFDTGKIKVVATTAFLSAFLYATAPINENSYIIILYIRAALLGAALLASLIVLFREKAVSVRATTICLILLTLVLLHYPFKNMPPEFSGLFKNAIIFSSAAIMIAYITSATEFSRKLKIYNLLILSVIGYLILIIFSSGISFDGLIPILNFSNLPSAPTNAIQTYSQGASAFLSVGVIAIVYKLNKERLGLLLNATFVAAAFVLFILSLAGGSRGEVLACVITVAILLVSHLRSMIVGILTIVIAIVIATLLLQDVSDLEKFPTIWRILFSIDTKSWGHRDVFIEEAIRLLHESPKCVIIGCGLAFFQNYYGYEFGNYPHNWIVEFVITFGLPLLLILGFSIAIFFYNNFRFFSSNEKFLTVLSFYFFIIACKSGSIIGEPILYGSLVPVIFSIRNSDCLSTTDNLTEYCD